MTHTTATLYGISNCDSVKKARAQLAQAGVAVTFHDFKKLGVPAAELEGWLHSAGWQRLLNRQGSTWRKLAPASQLAVTGAPEARALMLEAPSVIKRPVLRWSDGALTVGLDEMAQKLTSL
jgi:arsenate reductase (glutaredoxin)